MVIIDITVLCTESWKLGVNLELNWPNGVFLSFVLAQKWTSKLKNEDTVEHVNITVVGDNGQI